MNRQRSSLSRLLIAMLCACILFSNSFPSALLADTQDISALPINNEIQSANSSQESTTGSQRVGKDIHQIDWESVPWQQTSGASPFETLNLNAATTIQITTEGFSPATLSVFGPTDVTWVNSTAVTQTIRSGKPTIIATPTSLPATATATAIPPTATFTPIPATATPVPNATPTANGSVYLPLVSRQQSAVEQQNAATIPETTNASDLAADTILAILPPGAAYSKRYQEPGQFFFYLQDTPQFTGSVSLSGVGLLSSSPANGEGDVAVTRETILEFSGMLDANSVNSATFSATFSSKELATRLHLAADGRKVTLFYNDPLPANARVQVHIDGNKLKDNTGAMVDVDGDGQAGGQATIDFDTLTLTVLPGTMVCGRVFASALKAVSYGVSGSSVSVNDPLQGVTISVDGQEQTLRTTTDAQGNFCLNPAPAGRFFVHVDGRTASNNVPAGSYYPFVGKAWDSIPGQTNNVGEIYLPLVPPDTLQAVSASQETVVHFAPSVLAEFPDFADVKITVPANSLYADDGTMGGKVGIAPVPPDRLPGKLPPGLEFPVVITVQTDGATNFDKPVPVCFPNLPDPTLGKPLAPGEKNYLFSFNHDTGKFEPIGPMTVSPDGKLICSDPGVGIIAPGWHGSGPRPVNPPPSPSPCATNNKPNPNLIKCVTRCTEDYAIEIAGTTAAGLLCSALSLGGCSPLAALAIMVLSIKLKFCIERCQEDNPMCVPTSARNANKLFTEFSKKIDNNLPDDPILNQILTISKQIDLLLYPYVIQGLPAPSNVQIQINGLVAQANDLAGGNAEQYMRNYLAKQDELLLQSEELGGNAPEYPVFYLATIQRPSGPIYLRGETTAYGQYMLFVPRDGTLLHVSFYDPVTKSYALIYPHIQPNSPFALPRFTLQPVDETFPDFDIDGLVDVAELVYGTDPAKADTDGDTISDGTEVVNGTDPLDGLPARTGIIGTADTPGTAVDVCATGDLVAVADSDAGVALFNVFNGMQPKLIAQVDTPGNASAVACSKDHVYVADGSGGLAVIDIRDPANAQIARRIPLAAAQAVAVVLNHAYVASGSDLVLVDLNTGEVVDRVSLNATVQDVTVGGDYLYVLTVGTLFTFKLDQNSLSMLNSISSPGEVGAGLRRWRLFAAENILYAVNAVGYNTFTIANPEVPQIIKIGTTAQRGWKQIVDNGSGLGIAAVSPNTTNDGPHNISLYDVSDPSQTNRFLTEFQTPGLAAAVALNNGLAFAADSQSGLQVINYVSYDSKGISPTISLTSNYAPGVAEENSPMRLSAVISDDVQVRNVEFYIDGVLAETDGNYPFETRFTTPSRNSQPSFNVRAKATDTGGNFAWTDTISYTLVVDATPPRVLSITPQAAAWVPPNTLNKISATFNESMAPASFTAATFQLFNSGNDKLLGTSDDQPVAGTVSYDEASKTASLTLPADLGAQDYRVVLKATDLAGNPIKGGEYSWNFYVGILTWDGGGDNQSWHDPLNWSSDQVPSNGALVIIDSTDARSIVYSQGDVTLGSVQSNRPLQIISGKLTINGDSLLTSLSQAGGELSGSGVITVTNLTWTDGTMSGSGKTIVTDNLTLGVSGNYSVRYLFTRHLENAGVAKQFDGYLYIDQGGLFLNRVGATFTDLSTNWFGFYYYNSNTGQFLNQGTFVKNSASNTIFTIPFINSGTVDVQKGGVSQQSGGRNSGTIKVAATAGVNFAGGHIFDPSSQLTGAGNVEIDDSNATFGSNFAISGKLFIGLVKGSSGTVTFTAPINPSAISLTGGTLVAASNLSIPTLTLNGGELSGSGVITVTNLTWTDGTMSGSGKTIVTDNLTLGVSGNYSVRYLFTRHLENAGVAKQFDGYLYIDQGGLFLNRVGATFTDLSANWFGFYYYNSNTGQFLNQGTFVKNSASNTIFTIPFINSGTVDVQKGAMSLDSNGTNIGLIKLATSTVLDINAAFINQTSGHISGTGTLDRSNATSFTNNGTIDPTVVVIAP